MALSNPLRKTVDAVAKESLADADVVALMVQKDGTLNAYKFNAADAAQTQDYVPIAGVVEHKGGGGSVASGDTVSVVVQGYCRAKVYPQTTALTAGSAVAFLYLADENTDAAASGCFCSDIGDTSLAATAVVTDLTVDAQQANYIRGVRGIFVGDATVTAGTTVAIQDVFVYNNPIVI
tara:strand:+ start:1350 stop:1883 length:534 start_codon:yes stop_codon:yes gene_type:complete